MSSAKPYESRPGWALCYPKKIVTADWTGVTVIDGKKYWVNIWEKIAADGTCNLSVSIQPKEN
jgi:hypothetical protein